MGSFWASVDACADTMGINDLPAFNPWHPPRRPPRTMLIDAATQLAPGLFGLLLLWWRRRGRRRPMVVSNRFAHNDAFVRPGLSTSSLEGLRGIATLHVGTYHLFQIAVPQSWTALIRLHGETSVTFFYLISGFVLTLSYGDRFSAKHRPANLHWSFFVRRTARLIPMYYVSNACVYALRVWTGNAVRITP